MLRVGLKWRLFTTTSLDHSGSHEFAEICDSSYCAILPSHPLHPWRWACKCSLDCPSQCTIACRAGVYIIMRLHWLTGSLLGRDGRSVYLGTCRNCTEVRLSEGCSGILAVLTKGSFGWGTATDRYFGADEVRVVCRQLNCGEVLSPKRFFTN